MHSDNDHDDDVKIERSHIKIAMTNIPIYITTYYIYIDAATASDNPKTNQVAECTSRYTIIDYDQGFVVFTV